MPAEVRDRDRQMGLGAAVLRRYERVCFDRDHMRVAGKPKADLVAPGHPLLDAVVDLVVERYVTLLKQGAVFVEIGRDATARSAGAAPYLDYRAATTEEAPLIEAVLGEPWLERGIEEAAVSWAVEHGISEHLADVTERVRTSVARTRRHVRQRLTQEINYWDARHANLLDQQASGRTLNIRPETAEKRARDLERRLEHRLAELDADEGLRPLPPVVAGGVLVVPHNNPGFDIRSLTSDGHWMFIEVKGRMLGAEDFSVTRNEVLYAKNADRYRLALVSVHPDGPQHDQVRYLAEPFKGFEFGDFAADGVRGDWTQMWARGGPPQ